MQRLSAVKQLVSTFHDGIRTLGHRHRRLTTRIGTHATRLRRLIVRRQRTQTRTRGTDRTGSTFLTTVDRRVHAPLCNVLNATRLLTSGPTLGTRHSSLQTVASSNRSLLAVLGSVLSCSTVRTNNGGISIDSRPFRPHPLLRDALRLVDKQIGNHPVHLTATVTSSVPYTLVNSPQHVHRIVAGLLDGTLHFASRKCVVLHDHASNRR